MILVCTAEDFRKFRKIQKIINLKKNHKKICHKQNVKCLMFFQVDKAGLQSPVLEFDKNCTQNGYFLQKLNFCIFEPQNREVIENSSKTPLNFSSLHYTYLGKN